jgi:hypothetical protein
LLSSLDGTESSMGSQRYRGLQRGQASTQSNTNIRSISNWMKMTPKDHDKRASADCTSFNPLKITHVLQLCNFILADPT